MNLISRQFNKPNLTTLSIHKKCFLMILNHKGKRGMYLGGLSMC